MKMLSVGIFNEEMRQRTGTEGLEILLEREARREILAFSSNALVVIREVLEAVQSHQLQP